MKSIDLLRRRLADLLPGQQEEINQTRQTANLLEIAVEALEFRSDTLFSTGSGLGKKVGREYSRQAAVTRAKAERKREIDQKLVDRHHQSLVKVGAGIINLGRAGTMDYDALVDNLNCGHFSGAIIDVFEPEPLPPTSILWKTHNLLVTPHVSADDGNAYVDMTLDLVFENLKRYLNGQKLNNVVRPELGY